jgi:hypothetical protein
VDLNGFAVRLRAGDVRKCAWPRLNPTFYQLIYSRDRLHPWSKVSE